MQNKYITIDEFLILKTQLYVLNVQGIGAPKLPAGWQAMSVSEGRKARPCRQAGVRPNLLSEVV